MRSSSARAPERHHIELFSSHCHSTSLLSPSTVISMKATSRLLASVRSGRFLEAGTPTGLTGLRTHPSPRWALMYTYTLTLNRLKTLPETSVYRQSTEALTKHRLKILEEVKPEGWDAWKEQQDASLKAKADALKAENQRESSSPSTDGVRLEPKMVKDKDGKLKPEERKDAPKGLSNEASTAAAKETFQKKIDELEATARAEAQATQSETSREERVHHEMAQADQEFGPLPEVTEPPLSAEQYVV